MEVKVPYEPAVSNTSVVHVVENPIHIVGGIERLYVGLKMWSRIFKLAFSNYPSVREALVALKKLSAVAKGVYGRRYGLKMVENDGKYYYSLYTPGFPSKAFDHHITKTLNGVHPFDAHISNLTFIFFAITRKCPLRCEHCFEADNLNQPETFSLEELKTVVAKFRKDDLSQFHFSGGEPLVRMRDLKEIIKSVDGQSECWVLTSGFNLTADNALQLKDAGATGVVVSLDHFDESKHNKFRNFDTSHQWVLKAIANARSAGLVVAVSLCATREFVNWENLLRYAAYVKSLGVQLVQLLEPKPAGAYRNKHVLLDEEQYQLLEKFYLALNYDKQYHDFPVVVYHGYHQRRVGCFSGGFSNIYIDSAGYVNACPFCSTKHTHIIDMLESDARVEGIGCPAYESMIDLSKGM